MAHAWSVAELEALADGLLAPTKQLRLDHLLTQNAGGAIAEAERRELDHLLQLVDQLTILKTRARYTLGHLKMEPTAT